MSPREELEQVLSVELSDGILAHRKAMRCPLTPLAARLLAAQFALTSAPDKAAELMLEMGWRGFKASWMDRSQGRSYGLDHFGTAIEAEENGHHGQVSSPSYDQGDARWLQYRKH